MQRDYDYQKFWDVFHDSSYYNPSQRHRFRLICREVAGVIKARKTPPAEFRVLDLGCGMGHLLLALKQRFPQLVCTGVDISVSAIEALRKNVPGVTWQAADLQEPSGLQTLGLHDIVICSEVLEHVPQYERVLESIQALLAPQGTAIVTVPGGTRYRFDDDLGHLRHFTLDQVRSFFPSASMKIVRSYCWGFPAMNLFRYTSDRLYHFVAKEFTNTRYGWKKRLFCQLLYLFMFAAVKRRGPQIVCLFEKA
jgi:ubiquinone/menaquinone biosynthesis C-methylase UbiE